MKRRQLLTASALAMVGCAPPAPIEGGFTGSAPERGHLLRQLRTSVTPTVTHRVHTLIAGGGIAGLAAARALRQRGHDDFAVLELEDSAGGNSRAGSVNGIVCPLGAHYLPLPGDQAHEVQDLLEELGLRQRVAGRWRYDERHLCHSPQERLFFNGEWQEGLLPVQGVGAATLAQYQRFADAVAAAHKAAPFAMPAARAPHTALHRELGAISLQTWLARQGLTDPLLGAYLDYACRDDYGAGSASVSAFAGLHYFASRHGFHAPGAQGEGGDEREAVLTWPQGNGWLSQQLAAPLGRRLHTGSLVQRIEVGKHGVSVDSLNTATGATERWLAHSCIVALPIFVAQRVLINPPPRLSQAAQQLRYAPWLVANLHLRAPLHDRPGAPPSWDNVIHGAKGLGYVNAQHQSLAPQPGATVLTYYRALGDEAQGRAQLLERPWAAWRDEIVAELALPHPDLTHQLTRMEITRYGHAMAVPVPSHHAPWGLQPDLGLGRAPRLHFAHSDWSGYSVFEEAFSRGHLAGMAA